MILLDTNIIAELMRPAPLPAVVEWMNEQDAAELVLSTISVAEIQYGLEILPAGQRRARLETGFRKMAEVFSGRILSFDLEAAAHYGKVMGQRRAAGRPLGALDGQIAAIARSNGAQIATRNVRDFEGCGVEVVNPFPRDARPKGDSSSSGAGKQPDLPEVSGPSREG